MEFKDFLPLLIIIGSVIFSFLGKKKKLNKDQNENPEKSIWETLLGEDEDTRVGPVEQHYNTKEELEDEWWEKEESVVEVTEKEQFTETVFNRENEEILENVQPAVAHKDESPIFTDDLTKKKTSKHIPNFSDKDAIKKGIIFSEVFNRKKY